MREFGVRRLVIRVIAVQLTGASAWRGRRR